MLRPTLALALLAPGCTYDPPLRSAAWYENPEEYSDDSATHPRREALQAYLDEAVAEGLPGAAMLVRTPEGTWAGAAGYADLASGVPWQPDMIGRVGSATKTLAAAVILRLIDQGDLSPDDVVGDLLPARVTRDIANAEVATIRQLLNHTSGIYDYVDDPDLLLAGIGSYAYEHESREELLDYARGHDALFAPGEGWGYSSTGFLLLELIAEEVTGADSRDLMRDLVLEPAGLRSTLYDPDLARPPGLTRGYADIFGDERLVDVTDTALERFYYDGGAISNVYDLAAFLDALVSPSFLSEDALALLLDPAATGGASDKGTDLYGAGLIIEETEEFGTVYGHSGTALGHTAHVYRVPDADVTFAVIVNGSQGAIEERSYRWFSPLRYDDVLRLVAEKP